MAEGWEVCLMNTVTCNSEISGNPSQADSFWARSQDKNASAQGNKI